MVDKEIVKIIVTLKSNAEFEIVTTSYEVDNFNKRYHKYIEGLCARTDNYRVLYLNNHVFIASEIAAYYAIDMSGKPYKLKRP